MYQEIELILLAAHLRNPYMIVGIHYQDMFQILYSKIWNSEFLDSISRNQKIRVLNYVELVAMRNQKMCLNFEGKWCPDHECENSCFVFFNPYDREDDTVEETQQEIMEEDEMLLSCDQFDQISERDIEQEMKKELKDSMMFDEKFEGVLEIDIGEELQSDPDPIIEFEATNIGKQIIADLSSTNVKLGINIVELWSELVAAEKAQTEFNIRCINEDCSREDTCPQHKGYEIIEDVEITIGKLSLTERPVVFGGFSWSLLPSLLGVYGQSTPVKLLDTPLKYCGLNSIVKVGEGTFEEAYNAGENVHKMVPFGGEFKVTREMQKRPKELLKEAVFSCTLNHLRKQDGNV